MLHFEQVYGESHVRKALEMGVVDTLLISEDLRKYRIKLKCQSCNNTKDMVIDEDSLNDL